MSRRRHGVSLLYMALMMTALCAMFSLALDFGRVQVAKTELRRAADSAARAGAAGLLVDNFEAITQAQRYAGLNPVDGLPLLLTNPDIQIGTWSSSRHIFSTVNGASGTLPTAIRIVARKTPDRGTGVPMLFASLAGFNSCALSAESIATVVAPINVDETIPATANPFLAGMPPGSIASVNNPHNSPDYAGTASNPRQSPYAVNMPLQDGQTLTFDSIAGMANHDPSLASYNPDGDLNDIGHNNTTPDYNNNYSKQMYNENGIADVVAPINSLVGIFLDNNQPNLTSAPANLDFSTSASRDFTRLTPSLKQIFFIGDGLNSKGQRQEFIVPKGATRLYLATWDFYEWNNNGGSREVQVIRPMQITLVK